MCGRQTLPYGRGSDWGLLPVHFYVVHPPHRFGRSPLDGFARHAEHSFCRRRCAPRWSEPWGCLAAEPQKVFSRFLTRTISVVVSVERWAAATSTAALSASRLARKAISSAAGMVFEIFPLEPFVSFINDTISARWHNLSSFRMTSDVQCAGWRATRVHHHVGRTTARRQADLDL